MAAGCIVEAAVLIRYRAFIAACTTISVIAGAKCGASASPYTCTCTICQLEIKYADSATCTIAAVSNSGTKPHSVLLCKARISASSFAAASLFDSKEIVEADFDYERRSRNQ